MAKILSQCPDCGGSGEVRHVKREWLAEGELRNPNGLDQYKTTDLCERCGGSGKRMIEVSIEETQPPAPAGDCCCLRNGIWIPSPRSGKLI
jgi:DnaJ-class molecular chaperone